MKTPHFAARIAQAQCAVVINAFDRPFHRCLALPYAYRPSGIQMPTHPVFVECRQAGLGESLEHFMEFTDYAGGEAVTIRHFASDGIKIRPRLVDTLGLDRRNTTV